MDSEKEIKDKRQKYKELCVFRENFMQEYRNSLLNIVFDEKKEEEQIFIGVEVLKKEYLEIILRRSKELKAENEYKFIKFKIMLEKLHEDLILTIPARNQNKLYGEWINGEMKKPLESEIFFKECIEGNLKSLEKNFEKFISKHFN